MAPRPEEIEGSQARANDRGDFGAVVLPDEQAALNVPAVVEGLVRSFLKDSIDTRTLFLKDGITAEAGLAKVVDGAQELQRIFYGKTNLYQRSEWNDEERLGKYLVENVNQGEAKDAIQRLLLASLKEIADAGDEAAAGRMDDEMVQATVDYNVAAIVAHLLGVPVETFTDIAVDEDPAA